MMDDKFYQFWSDLAARTASGQISPNEVTEWMRLGGAGSESLMSMFKKYYGQPNAVDNAMDAMMLESAMANFKKSLTAFYSMLDVVPKQDYIDLEKKYRVLQQKAADQEAVILQLKLLFKTCAPNVEEGINPLNQMLKTQNEQFLKMMESLAGFYGISTDPNGSDKNDDAEKKTTNEEK